MEALLVWLLNTLGGTLVSDGAKEGAHRWSQRRAVAEAAEEVAKAAGDERVGTALAIWAEKAEQPGREVLESDQIAPSFVDELLMILRLQGATVTREAAGELVTQFAGALHRRLVNSEHLLLDRRNAARAEAILEAVREVGESWPKLIGTPPSGVDRFVGRGGARHRILQAIQARTPVVQIHGKSGYGKSALAARAVMDLEHEHEVAALVFISSRDRGGLSLDRIVHGAARVSPDPVLPIWSSDLPLPAKIEAVRDAFRDCVVLLDDLDPVVKGGGGVTDDALAQFLKAWQSAPPHRAVLVTTSQIAIAPLSGAGVHLERLDRELPLDEAKEMIRNLLERDDDRQDEVLIERLALIADCVPRGLELVARSGDIVAEARAVENNEALRRRVTGELLDEVYRALDPREIALTEVLAAFATPVPVDMLDASVAEMQQLHGREIVKEPEPGLYTLHPLDLRYVQARLMSDETRWRALHRDIARLYREQRRPVYATVEDVAPNLREFEHLVEAGEYSAAAAVIEEIDFDYLSIWGQSQRLLALRLRLEDHLSGIDEARNLLGIGAAYAELGAPRLAVGWYSRALDKIGDDAALAQRAAMFRSMACIHTGDFIGAERILRAYVADPDPPSDDRCTGQMHSAYGLALLGLGRAGESLAHMEIALDVAARVDPRGHVRRCMYRGMAHLHLGRVRSALEDFEQTRQLATARGDVCALARLSVWEGRALALAGRVADALTAFGRADEATRNVFDVTGTAMVHVWRAAALRDIGRLDEALEEVATGEQIARDKALHRLLAEALIIRTHILLDRGERNVAHRLEEAEAIAREMPRELAAAVAARARVAAYEGQWREVSVLASDALSRPAAAAPTAVEARALALRAALHLRSTEAVPDREDAAPLDAEVEVMLLRTIRHGGSFDDVRRRAETLLATSDGALVAARYAAGCAASAAGDRAAAKRYLTEACSLPSASGLLDTWRDIAVLLAPFDDGFAVAQLAQGA